MDYFNIGLRSYTIILFISTLSFIAGSNVNCNGKAFHCVNSTHFKICVDLGGGVSTTVDEFLIPCPRNTVCKQYNLFECELTTTLPPETTQNEVTNEQFQTSDSSVWEQLEITTIFPMKQLGMELSEIYFNKANTTPAYFTSSFLTDEVIDPVTSSNTKDLNTTSNSDIDKTLNLPRSIDKKLYFSTTEFGIDTAETLPYNVNILETDIGVSSNYNTEISTTQDRKTIDSIKSKSSKALNGNSLDLNAMLTVTESTNQVFSVLELPYSAIVKLLPGNFSNSLQESIPLSLNVTQLIKSDNMSQERNPPIIFNTNQINKSDNNTQYHNTNKDMLNSTTLYEKFINDVSNENKKIEVNSGFTVELPTQFLAEETTNDYPVYLNTSDAIKTFVNEGINITTNLKKISVTDDIVIPTSIISETSVVKTNETSIQFTNSGLNYGVSNIALTNPILEVKTAATSNKPQSSKKIYSNLTNGNEILNLTNEFGHYLTVVKNLNNNNTTTTEPNNNITPEISNGVIILKPLSDFILKNKTWSKPITMTVVKEIDNNYTTTTEPTYNITSEISNGVMILKPLSDLTSKNETWPKPIMMTVATDLDNNNTTTTEPNNNITPEISNGVIILKPLSDFILKNKTWSKPITMTVVKEIDNNYTTTTEPTNNITSEISNGVTILKPLSDLTSKNETWPKPIMMTVATDLDNNNTTTTEPSNDITPEISNGVMILKPISDFILKNETLSKPFMMTVATEVYNNNTTTTEPSYNITAEISNGVTILKPLSDLISKNETWPTPIMMTVATDLDNNNTTTTEPSNDITPEISNGVMILKPISDFILKNETLSKPITITVAKEVVNNNTTTTELSYNITAEISNGVTILKPLSDLMSKNETVVLIGNKDLNNNNTTTTEPSNNITAEIYNAVPTTFKIRPTDFKLFMVTDTLETFYKDNNFETTSVIFTDHQSLKESTASLSSLTKIKDIFMTKSFDTNSIRSISSFNSVINDLKPNTSSNNTSLPTTLDKPTTFLDSNSEILNKNKTTYNSDITKPVHNSMYEINNAFSSNSTFINKISALYETKTESDTATMKSFTGTAAFDSANSMDVTKSTFAVIDRLAQYRGLSDNNKSIDNTSKLESMITAKSSTFFVPNTSSKQVNSSATKTLKSQSSESTQKEMNKKQVFDKNTSNNDEILGKNSIRNLNLTKLSTTNIFIPKLVTSNHFSLSPALKITNVNNNISNINNNLTDNSNKNNFNLSVKSLTLNVTNTDFNYTYTNKASSVSSYSKSLLNSPTKPFLTDIYKVNPRNFGENISLTHTFDKTIPPNKRNETEDKESSQINQYGHASLYAIKNIEHEGNKSVYLRNPYSQVTTPAIEVNDTTSTLKEIIYNFSEPSSTVRNNVNDFFMENITMTSADKNTTTTKNYDKEGSGFNKSFKNSTTKTLVNINHYKNTSELADYFRLSGISNNQPSGYVIRPLLIEQKALEKVSKSSLHKDKENLALITEHRLQGHVSDRINKSQISEVSNVDKSELSAPFKNITSSNWGVVYKMVVAKPTKTFTYDRNVSEVKSLSVLRTRDNYTHDLNATSESSLTANNLLRNTSSQTYSINKTHYLISSNATEFSRTLLDHDRSSQTAEPSNIIHMETTPLALKMPKSELISKQDKISISDPHRFINTNRSNGIEEKQFRNGHGYLESTTISNSVTKNNGNHAKNSFTTPINNVNNFETKGGNMPPKQEFTCTNRGKYSDANNCNKFYICIGRVKPDIGLCPSGTVFSEYLKQCTKHISHCIRNNQFKCTRAGRFINILSNNTYFICARNKSSFLRYRLQCQKGYYLDKYNIKCTPEIINISTSDENNSQKTKELSFNKEMEGISVKSKHVFECEKEGKFKDPQDCRKYYICKKGRKSTFRIKIKQCDSDEVFHGMKKKCVDVESYECDL